MALLKIGRSATFQKAHGAATAPVDVVVVDQGAGPAEECLRREEGPKHPNMAWYDGIQYVVYGI